MDTTIKIATWQTMNYEAWDTVFIIDYLVQFHHRFVYNQTAFITTMAHRVADSNQARHPQIKQVAEIFEQAAKDFELYNMVEEASLFPRIKLLHRAHQINTLPEFTDINSVALAVESIKSETDKVLNDLRHVRELTNGFVAPAYSSSTCPLLYRLLEEYEKDTQTHLFIENNVLFPKALALESSLIEQTRLAGGNSCTA